MPASAQSRADAAEAEGRFVRALTAVAIEDFETARRSLDAVLEAAPGDVTVLTLRAEVATAMDAPADAVFFARRATEAAPASGQAEVIVDITSTGTTLKANGLKVLDDGVILESRAALAGSLKADWSDAAKASLEQLLASVEAVETAGTTSLLLSSSGIAPDALEGTGLSRLSENSFLSPSGRAVENARHLADSGGKSVSILKADLIFGQSTPSYEAFIALLGRPA